jgi:O-antigen ligase
LAFISSISLFKSLDRKYEIYIYLFFTSIFLTFSKNAWIATIFITLITLIGNKKNRKIIRNCIILTTIVIILISIFQKILLKQFYTNIISYTFIKILPTPVIDKTNLFDQDYYDNFNKIYGIGNFEKPGEHLDYLFNSNQSRFLIYKNTVKYIFEKPILGHGLNSHIEMKNIFKNKILTDNYESQFLTVLMEIGLVGFFIYSYIFVYSIKKIKIMKEFYITLIVGILSLLLFNSFQRNLFIFYLLAFIFSNIISTSKINRFNNKS